MAHQRAMGRGSLGMLFLLPHALMQIGLFAFMRALFVVAPQLFRKIGAFELRRRLALC